MSRPNNTVESLLTSFAPDEDAGWQWLRKLHELGYAINVVEPIAFFRGGEYVTYELRKGAVVWRAGRQGSAKADVVFPDPVAAAVWWETERQNLAPVTMPDPTQAPAWQSLPPFNPAPIMPSRPGDDAVRRAFIAGSLKEVHSNGTSGKP